MGRAASDDWLMLALDVAAATAACVGIVIQLLALLAAKLASSRGWAVTAWVCAFIGLVTHIVFLFSRCTIIDSPGQGTCRIVLRRQPVARSG